MRCSNEFIVAVMGLAKGIWNIKIILDYIKKISDESNKICL